MDKKDSYVKADDLIKYFKESAKAAYEVYCIERCSYKSNRKEEPERWKKLEPCCNCVIEGFVEYLEERVV